MSFNRLMDIQNMAHVYNSTIKVNIDTYHNVDDSHTHYTQWKKSVSNGYMLYDSISMAFLKTGNYIDEDGLVTAKG